MATPAAPTPAMTTRSDAHRLVDDPQRVLERGQRDDRGAVLVVVEHRDVEQVLEAVLDLEARRRRDVLEVDAAEHRRDPHDGLDDLVGRGDVEADREGVDPGEVLEQQRLALHHRQGRRPGRCRRGPSTAVPSVTMATVFFLIVSSWASAGCCSMAVQTRATPGV